MHHFADASRHAYGTVTYLRVTNPEDGVHCSFVIGKSHLSLRKHLTIPCLKLSAAVVATQLDKMVRKEIGIPINESIFWTDSSCVLGYIANEDKRFHTFVANRVAAIQEATSSSQWKHVGTKQNPADNASHGLSAEALLKGECWSTGPVLGNLKGSSQVNSLQTVQSQITTQITSVFGKRRSRSYNNQQTLRTLFFVVPLKEVCGLDSSLPN